MAEIFLARATGIEGFEKLVVIKRILPELKHDQEFVQMFLDEARLAATLHHSNIVQVYDIGEDDGSHFFSMEYLHGEDTRGLMRAAHHRGERVPLEHALSIAIGVCAGLHYAHEKLDPDGKPLGIVHRDVSPQNVAVTYDGGVKVMDFGIAKTRRRMTETRGGTLKGKLQYMAPEQCLGDAVDRRTDVFAIGILLWELSCTRRLYFGQSDFAIMKAITEHDATRPSEVMTEYPAELEAIVMKALARRPEDRFQTAEELQLQLEAFARERRLALSPVGLARWLRELFAGRVEAWSTAMRGGTQAIESFVLSRIEARDAGLEDDDPTAIEIEPLEPSASGNLPRRQTLAVSRPPSRRARWPWAVGAAAAAALALGGGTWALTHRRENANANVNVNAPAPNANVPNANAQNANALNANAQAPNANTDTPSVETKPAELDAPHVPEPAVRVEPRAEKRVEPEPQAPRPHDRPRPSRAHSHSHARVQPASKAKAAKPDLDAPLPPK